MRDMHPGRIVLRLFLVLAATAAGAAPTQAAGGGAQLAEALRYYYEQEYERALPLFQELAEQQETLDLLYWVGSSAAQSGRHELAVEKLKRLIAAQPDLHRARLELADVYIQTGRLKEARRELETVRAGDPPEAVRQGIDRRLALIERRQQKLSWQVAFSQGYQYDDNVSSGPDDHQVSVSGGTLSLNRTQQEVDGNVWLTRLLANARYDLGAPGDFFWNAGINFYNSVVSDHSEFNYTRTDITTGPLWAGPRDLVRLNLGYTDSSYGSERLSSAVHLDPSVEHFFTPAVSLQAAYTYADEDYRESKLAGADNRLHRLSFGPNFYLRERRHVVAAYYTYETRKAELSRNTYDADVLTATYFTRLPTDTELFVYWSWFDRRYESAPPLYGAKRKDRRHTFSLTATQRFWERYFASLGYTYMLNDSNAKLYDFDRNILTLNLGVTF